MQAEVRAASGPDDGGITLTGATSPAESGKNRRETIFFSAVFRRVMSGFSTVAFCEGLAVHS